MALVFDNNNITGVHYSGYTIDRIYACDEQLVYGTEYDYSSDYLTFTANGLRRGYMTLTRSMENDEWVEYYKSSITGWERLSDSGINSRIPLTWEYVKLRGNLKSPIGFVTHYYREDALDEIHFDISGNIMSLFYGSDFIGKTSFPTGAMQSCKDMFKGLYVDSAKHLVLPATTLIDFCYANMFSGCTSLSKAPELPATSLAQYCYAGMFSGCISLVKAPELPATALTNNCYSGMFSGCIGLTTAPELPAPTLVEWCYSSMFRDCTNLNYIKCLATDISANAATNYWVYNVASSGTFVKVTSMTSWTSGMHGIPTGWTVVNYDPPAPPLLA